MRRICMGSLLFLCASVLLATLSRASDGNGRIVFTKSEYTREGFEAYVLRGDKTVKGWWELYRRDICIINPDVDSTAEQAHLAVAGICGE